MKRVVGFALLTLTALNAFAAQTQATAAAAQLPETNVLSGHSYAHDYVTTYNNGPALPGYSVTLKSEMATDALPGMDYGYVRSTLAWTWNGGAPGKTLTVISTATNTGFTPKTTVKTVVLQATGGYVVTDIAKTQELAFGCTLSSTVYVGSTQVAQIAKSCYDLWY